MLAVAASSLYFLREEFTVVLIDEYGLPIDDADVKADVGTSDQAIKISHGRGVVSYYPFSAAEATLTISYRGMRKIARETRPKNGKFADVTVRLFSGREVISAAHLTADGIAIDALLKGELPPDLSAIYPKVVVLKNEVYDAARSFIDIYTEFKESGLEYERAVPDKAVLKRIVRAEVNAGGDNDPRLKTYFPHAQRLRTPMNLSVDVPLDMSADITGYSTDAPLPQGFRLRLLQPDKWYSGDEATPDEFTSQLLRSAKSPIGRTAAGGVAISLERLVSGSEIREIMGRSIGGSSPTDPSSRAYLDFMIRNDAPRGLIGASFHLDPVECGGSNGDPHIALELPGPELRVTLLKNTSDGPIRIQEILSVVRSGGELWRMDQAVAKKLVRSEFDILEPGEAILVPRWIGVRAIHTQDEVAGFEAAPSGRITTFYPAIRRNEYTVYDEAYYSKMSHMPKHVSIDSARVVTGVPASDRASASNILAGRRPRGPLYAIGPVVDEIDYVVNGVRLRSRPDNGSVISMVGDLEIGSCPFVFAHRRGAPELNIGRIIRDRIGRGAFGRDSIRIPSGTDRIELRELEDETSYIDAAALIVVRNRQSRRIPARAPLLSAQDGRSAVLRRGDRLWLGFDYTARDADQVWLEISGYYEPGKGRGQIIH
jgi:hypothetical protein